MVGGVAQQEERRPCRPDTPDHPRPPSEYYTYDGLTKIKKRDIIINMKTLIRGIEIQIDKDELWRLKKNKYYAMKFKNGKIYFYRHKMIDYKYYTHKLHREIAKTPLKLICDHINGNTLDNRKCNLRNCSHAENIRNQNLHRDNRSGYRGVSRHKNKWRAQIVVNYRHINIGSFETKEKAYEAYKKEAKKYFKKYANIS